MAMDWRSTSFHLFDGKANSAERQTIIQDFNGFLSAYEASGLNTVTLTWFNPVDPRTGEILKDYGANVPGYLQSLPTGKLLTELTQAAHDQGFKVAWKPHFISNNAKAGNIDPNNVNAQFDVNAFLANVDTYWAQLAPKAEQVGVDLLILGTEHSTYAGPAHDTQWRQIISTARSVYNGELTYDALSYIDLASIAADDITFWDALDYIGISMYLPLATDSTPSLTEAYSALFNNKITDWHTGPLVDVPAAFQALAQAWGKDIIFTEAGSQSRFGALESPPYSTGDLDFGEQTILYAVLMDVFSKYSWFRGVNWWNNDHDYKSAPGTEGWKDFWYDLHKTEFGFLGKPAGDIVRGFWGDGADGNPLTGNLQLGTKKADFLTGGNLNDLIVAAGGNDEVQGLGGNDRLFGGDGADTIDGGAGDDFLYGGSSFRDSGDLILGGDGSDTAYGGYGNDVIKGGTGNDLLRGEVGKDRLVGGSGNDKLEGGSGVDNLVGGSGNDVLVGGARNDKLNGGGGNDKVIGSKGNDRLKGGGGADEFVFSGKFGKDVIVDFNGKSESDVIDLIGIASVTSFRDLKQNHATNQGDDLLLQFGSQTILILDTQKSDLEADDFLF